MTFDYDELIDLIDSRIASALDRYVEEMMMRGIRTPATVEAMEEVIAWLRC